MRALIHCPEADTGWIRRYFADEAPYLLKICNKPYLEYLIEFCVLNGVDRIKIVTDLPEQGLDTVLGNGERWGVPITYGMCAPGSAALELPAHYAGELGGDSLLIFSGIFFPNYDKRNFQPVTVAPGECRQCGEQVWLLGADVDWRGVAEVGFERLEPWLLRILPLSSLRDFYERSMALLQGMAVQYNMPSYNNTPDVYIGQNVAISRTADVRAPVMIGSVIQIGENTQVGSLAVIGDNSFIDDNTTIERSVVMGNSYVGCYLELKDKIVYQNHIINPYTGQVLDIIDDFVLSMIEDETTRRRCSYFQRLMALLLWMLMLPGFLLLRPWLRIRWKLVECYLSADRQKSIRLRLYLQPSNGWAARWFRRLSLDRFHLLPLVIRGELRLVGSLLLPVSRENYRLLSQFPDYAPGLFSYSEMLGHDRERFQMEMDELYYIYHTDFELNWLILRRTLLRNLLKEV